MKKATIYFIFPFLISACTTSIVQKASIGNVCESESYNNHSEYKVRHEKDFVNTLKNGEQVYLQTHVQRCEEIFSEETGVECGIQKTIKLIWEKDKQLIDSFSFLDSGCQEPQSPSLRMEPWDQNDVKVQRSEVNVIHYWNYYSSSDEDDEKCMSRIFKLDRQKMKFQDLGEKSCHQN